MVQTLEAIKGGGGSIKVGTTGTISSLMSKELESMRYAPRKAIPSKDKSSAAATVLATGGVTSPKRLRPRLSANEASSSHCSNISDRNDDLARKEKHYNRKNHKIPMLNSGDVSVDATPIRKKPDKKGSYLVEIVDIKCGHPDRAWATPLANRLKKLSFSKLSESTN
ncbi:Hexon [Heracleum sosnowskyi]|uniref:Hexon n=1 Tax=Heracleum sosnowskyi TaxID=360622 RepID=A0AAD8IWX3_9APIA|nr:Hexon [Heracleum sosnowskyi]